VRIFTETLSITEKSQNYTDVSPYNLLVTP